MDFSSSIFQKLSQKIPTETIVRDFLLEYLKEKHGIEIKRNQIILKKNTIELKIPTILKVKINPYLKTILQNLQEFLKEKEVSITIKLIH